MSKAKEIFDGFFNLVKGELDLLDKETRKLAITRSSICNSCEANINNVCDETVSIVDLVTKQSVPGCGCFLPAKVLSPSSQCPANKW
tara:strand:+ start:439 stop:699 length:261 start_codon:yes stop_codon:yes gene_type:complete